MQLIHKIYVSLIFILLVGCNTYAQESSGTVFTFGNQADFENNFTSDCGPLDDLILEDFTGGVTTTTDCFNTISSDAGVC